jgi:hypothetical protein
MLYRHRGHRYISTRQFDKASRRYGESCQAQGRRFRHLVSPGLGLLPEGQIRQSCEGLRKLQGGGGKRGKEIRSFAVSDWLYMAYRRMGKTAEAAKVLERITPQMQVKENKSYFDRLLFYKGLKKEEELVNVEKATDLEIATVGYGLGNWHLYNGKPGKGRRIFPPHRGGKYWHAFGFIAAEAEIGALEEDKRFTLLGASTRRRLLCEVAVQRRWQPARSGNPDQIRKQQMRDLQPDRRVQQQIGHACQRVE